MSENRVVGVLEGVAVAILVLAILASVHPELLATTTLITGGDTGAHVGAAWFLRQGGLTNLTPWFPGWFDGMPLYTYYFVLPDVVAVLGSYLVAFTVSFKIMTVLGSLLLPLTTYALGRLLGASRPIPLAMAGATLPFLFDSSFTIDGGNLFSTMAGEYAFSLSLALALLAIGLFARGMRTGRGYWLAAVVLATTLLSHLLPWFFAIAMIGLWLVGAMVERWRCQPRRDAARPIRFVTGAGLLSAGLVAWWALPFATLQSYTNSMGYVNDPVTTTYAIFSKLGWWNDAGGASGDRWVLILAAIGFIVAWIRRDRVGIFLALWCVLAFCAFVFDPQGVIWNERLVPFWFLGTHLLAGWLVGFTLLWYHERTDRQRRAYVRNREALEHEELGVVSAATQNDGMRWLAAERRSMSVTVVAVTLLASLASVLPGQVPAVATALHLNNTGNQVASWAAFNYGGYQRTSGWAEYHDLMSTMKTTARRYGCGPAMWEYSSDEQRFGTPMALMLLPYWTNNCVTSMEGLFFESSATTPYHFLNQAELSTSPSDPQLNLAYGSLDVPLGITHLQMLGVRYYIAFSAATVAAANKDKQLTAVATTKYWPSSGVRWHIYLIRHAPLVTGLRYAPTVVAGLDGREAWLRANEHWWLTPAMWPTLIAASGPTSWPHVTSANHLQRTDALSPVKVTDVVEHVSSLAFRVSRIGVPVLVKVSYFPRWHVTGAQGPFRVSPNLMVVVPTSTSVVLRYTSTPPQQWGEALTSLTVLVGALVGVRTWRRRWIGRR